jgi:putative PIN family toxin of toxin-antitoxin system
MRIVIDTNVFISGVFFTGPPSRILTAWRDGLLVPVVSAEILEEYRRVGQVLGAKFADIDIESFLALLAVHGIVVHAPPLQESVCEDPDDDKFLACALAAGVPLVVSGDRHLLKVSGYKGVSVLRPRAFVDTHLEE